MKKRSLQEEKKKQALGKENGRRTVKKSKKGRNVKTPSVTGLVQRRLPGR